MSKAEEATNDFCTRCSKYDRCTKAQSECTMADSYQEGYEDGYDQAGKGSIENKHEKSWRLGEQLWKGIKTMEEASYQYMYDASNDWAYDVPTWEDVQDAFKAGAEWKKNPELTWKDIADILNITDVIANDDSMEERLRKMSEEEYYQEVLKRFENLKEKKEK